MKKFAKLLAVLLVVAMMATMIAGCVQPPVTTTPPAGNDGTTAGNVEEKHYLTATIVSEMRVGDFKDREKFPVWQKFNEMLEERGLYVTWNMIERDQYATYLTTTLASPDDMPEYVWLDTGYLDLTTKLECAETGVFYSIDKILEYSDGTASKYFEDHPDIKGKIGYKGEMYWLGETMRFTYGGELTTWGEPVGLLVREDWLNALNKEIPTTPEAFEAYLAACQANDMNGNGVVDEYYLANFDQLDYGLTSMYGIPSNFYGLNLTTGKIDSTYEMAETKDYYKFIRGLVAKGYIKEDYVGNPDYPSDDEAANQAAATWNYYCNNWTISACKLNVAPDANYVGCIPTTEKGFIQHDGAPLIDNRSAAFTSALKDPKAAAILLDVLCSEEFSDMSVWGLKDITYTEDADGTRTLVDDASDPEKGKVSGIAYGRDIWGFNALTIIELRASMDPNKYTNYCTTEKMAEVNSIGCRTGGTYNTHHSAYMQNPTSEEAEVMSELEADLKDLYKQIHADLLLGNIDIDTEWDSKVVQPLKDAGLDELLAVYQARADRFAGK